ncbi:hypothetical protein X971_2385 [Agrobacterium tumefaciens LBA4213 (Ach5)]|nr:hypothetical protein X971_2385 [Agrobacterium tumefaciens LBA4213 (Ach5)]
MTVTGCVWQFSGEIQNQTESPVDATGRFGSSVWARCRAGALV